MDILKCPFCGGLAAECHNENREHAFFVFCTECAAEGSGFGEAARAGEWWNKRATNATSEQLTKENAALKVDYANAYIDLGDLHNKLNQANEAKERAEKELFGIRVALQCGKSDIVQTILDRMGARTDDIAAYVEVMEERDQLREAKEKAERQAAEMRKALVFIETSMKSRGYDVNSACRSTALNALESTSGTSYVPSSDLKEARELLESVEWPLGECPYCHSYKSEGHTKDCKLQAFLAKL